MTTGESLKPVLPRNKPYCPIGAAIVGADRVTQLDLRSSHRTLVSSHWCPRRQLCGRVGKAGVINAFLLRWFNPWFRRYLGLVLKRQSAPCTSSFFLSSLIIRVTDTYVLRHTSHQLLPLLSCFHHRMSSHDPVAFFFFFFFFFLKRHKCYKSKTKSLWLFQFAAAPL